jgi:hypothetical protein
MKRALYVDGKRVAVSVSLDGPALRLRQPGRADARAPLRLLARVIASGDTEWTMPALLACCDRGVPVAFLHGDGAVRGWCLGETIAEPEINALLEDATSRPAWPGEHADWLRALERRALLAAMGSIGVMTTDLRPAAVWTACEERIDRLAPPVEAARIMRVFDGALAAHVADLAPRRCRRALRHRRGRRYAARGRLAAHPGLAAVACGNAGGTLPASAR